MSDQPVPPMTPHFEPVEPPGRMRTGMAISALVLGIFGLVACPPLGILAIIQGIVAINRATREPGRYGGKGMAIGGVVCGGVSILLAPFCISILLPSLSRARELSKRLVCQANMKGIVTVMRIYQNDFSDQGVQSFDVLVSEGLLEADRLVCPSSGLDTSNYIYIPWNLNDPNVTPDTVIMYEPKSNHGGEGGNVIFADGHAEFLKGEDYDRLIQGLPPPGL